MSTYIPDRFKLPTQEFALEVVRRYPFATLITGDGDEPRISHIPLLWHGPEAGPLETGELIGHFAGRNPHAKLIGIPLKTVAVFHGPHLYISPSWYRETVITPTWNSVTVHITGQMQPLDEEAAERALRALISTFEAELDPPWDSKNIPEEQWLGLRRGTVPLRLTVDRVEAKGKLNQNRTENDRRSVIATLRDRGRLPRKWRTGSPG